MSDFDRYAPAMAVYWLGSAAMAFYFGGIVLIGGSPIQEETYGKLVHSIPALYWVAAQISLSLLAALSAAYRSPRWASLFGALITVLLATFGVLSLQAPQGSLVQAGAIMWLCPVSALATLICMGAWNGRA